MRIDIGSMQTLVAPRLRTVTYKCRPHASTVTRRSYISYPIDVNWPFIVASAVVTERWPFMDSQASMLDWIEVSSMWRRRGYASELVGVIRAHQTCPLQMTEGVTSGGSAFLDELERRESESTRSNCQ